MEIKKLLEKLTDLAQLDIDAVHAYTEALSHIDNSEIYQKIHSFKQDHINHIENISSLIKKFGGTPPEHKKDFKGYLIEGFTSLRSITGTIGALKAMESNEKLTNKVYKEALVEKDLPTDVLETLQNNYKDEVNHLKYIIDAIESMK